MNECYFRVPVYVLARYSLVSSSVPLFGELVLDISIRMRVATYSDYLTRFPVSESLLAYNPNSQSDSCSIL